MTCYIHIMGIRVIVCGGRDFDDAATAFRALHQIHVDQRIGVILHGGCRGADTLAGQWAQLAGVSTEVYHADWMRHGRAAGPIRNAAMIADGRPDLCVAFPGGRGTADMVRKCAAADVIVVEPL